MYNELVFFFIYVVARWNDHYSCYSCLFCNVDSLGPKLRVLEEDCVCGVFFCVCVCARVCEGGRGERMGECVKRESKRKREMDKCVKVEN